MEEKAEEFVWKHLSKVFFVLFTQYGCNMVFALLARQVKAVAEALPRVSYSLSGFEGLLRPVHIVRVQRGVHTTCPTGQTYGRSSATGILLAVGARRVVGVPDW